MPNYDKAKRVQFDDRWFRSTNEALWYAFLKIIRASFYYEKWDERVCGWWADFLIMGIPGLEHALFPNYAEVKSIDKFDHELFDEAKRAILSAVVIGHEAFQEENVHPVLFQFGHFPRHDTFDPMKPVAAVWPYPFDEEPIPLIFGIGYDYNNIIGLTGITEPHMRYKPVETDVEIQGIKALFKDAEDWVKLDFDREFILKKKIGKKYETIAPILQAAHAGVDLELKYCSRDKSNMDVKGMVVVYDSREEVAKRLATTDGLVRDFFLDETIDYENLYKEEVK